MKLVHLKWIDSYSPTHGGWQGLGKRDDSMLCESVGWIVDESDLSITLAGHISHGGEGGEVNQVAGEMTIPKTAIVKRSILPTKV